MYYVTCDSFPLLDWRDNDLILVSPKVKLEVNTVGEGSFTIYKTHPHYDKLKKLKSVFEVSDENGVIFRGRATGDTVGFDHGMAVDLEGAMAFFNDSIVRPFDFPNDFKEDPDYIAAAESGNVISFFLAWLIGEHNEQVEDFQRMKLGNVTVVDPNNYITRSSSEYASTWATLRGKLFESSLGGYLCIRYEADGNYIDYLEDFTEVNTQEIAFGENILDLKKATEATGTYSAIIPIGAAGLTIKGKANGNITDDLVKSGDTIYSRKAVAEYGWIYAPVSDTTWEDVTDDANLLTKGGEWLANGGMLFSHGVEVTAVDLHFSDKQIESLRIYKKVNVRSAPHNLSEQFPLTCLEIELLEPQNTKITVGKTVVPLTERTVIQQDETRQKYSTLSKTDEEIKMAVRDAIKEMESSISTAIGGITLSVSSKNGSTTFTLTDGEATLSTKTLNLSVNAANISGKLEATQIKAEDLEVNAAKVKGTLTASSLELSGLLELVDSGTLYGYMGVNKSKGGPVICDSGKNNFFVATANAAKMSYAEEYMIWVAKDGCYSNENMKVYSDQRLKNGISYDFDKEEVFFASLKPCSFQMAKDKTGKKRWGFVAQDVIESAVAAGFDAEKLAAIGSYEGMNTLAYNEFTALNTYMIQRVMHRLTELETKIT